MPGFNEAEAIGKSLRALLAIDYPHEKLELIAVNDGSTDSTLQEMQKVAGESGGRVRVIDFPENRGKRAAMAAGIRASTAEVVAFVDSDSVVEPDALRKLVQPLAEDRVGAVCGHANVLNISDTWLTRMQAVRYFVAFRVVKAAESVFSTVTCCSGCFSAYRREAILPRMDWWENQHFLGVESTFGDDRSLTNCVLRDWQVVLRKERRLAHDRPDHVPRLRHPADTVEALVDAGVAAGGEVHLAQAPGGGLLRLPQHRAAATGPGGGGARDRRGARSPTAARCRSSTSPASTHWRWSTRSTTSCSRMSTAWCGSTGCCSSSSTSGSCCGRPTTRSPPAAPRSGVPAPPRRAWRRALAVSATVRRALAQALLPAAILPVLLLGPGLARAPWKLWRQFSAEVQRLTENDGGAADRGTVRPVAHAAIRGTARPAAREVRRRTARPGAQTAAMGIARPAAHTAAGGRR